MVSLITGGNGQLGKELRYYLEEKQEKYFSYDADDMDITDKVQVQKVFTEVKPDVVYHCAAYTAVDAAEENKEKNWDVNVNGTRNIAEAAEKVGATLIYISTDYIFDGEKKQPYTEEDMPNPLNEYGKAKLAGEKIVSELMSKYYIVRTSWVFGHYGKNFVYTMLQLAETHNKLTVVDDQIGRPTWTRTLAEFMYHLIQTKPAHGIYQLSNEESCSWYEFAVEILKDKNVKVLPIPSEDYPQKAARSNYSIMDLNKAKETGFEIPTWKNVLNSFMRNI